MKAALWYKRNDIRIEEVQEPQVKPGQVKVKVKWCGICGTDLHEYLAGPILISAENPHPLTGDKAPAILGHEFSGDVVEIGEGVTTLKLGDRVVVEPLIVCGKCPACREGKYNLCSLLSCVGYNFSCGGGFAEYAVADERFVHKLPDTITYEEAALVEPLSVALHSVRQANFKIGQTALVLGCGPIGLSTIANLKAAGASLIIALQRKSIRQEYAKKAGADYVFDPNEVNILEEVRRLTGGIGVDAAFETTASQSGFDIGLESVKVQGTFVITSVWKSPVQLNPNALLFTEKHITGSPVYRHEFPMTLALIADKRIKPADFISKRISLDDLMKEGIDVLAGEGKKDQVKIIVTPDKSLL